MKAASSKQKILIVDDALLNLKILDELLHNEYDVRIANSGEKALHAAESIDPPDLILLDIVMPGMDGYEVCRRLKDNPATKHIPVIFITGRASAEDEICGLELGAVDYVVKPFNPVVVKARVKTHMELKRLRDELEFTSYRDGLTGIANRRRFNEYLAITWNSAVRHGTPLSLVLMDIDHFKLFNDQYGHQEGDDCLIKIAQCLSSVVRRKTDLIARYGGEEFVCILPGTEAENARIFSQSLCDAVANLGIPHASSSVSNFVTISLGVAGADQFQSSQSSGELLKAADKALYQSKESGRNKVTVVDLGSL